MEFPKLKKGQHCLIVGQTGSGKTVLAHDLILRARFVVVLDIKRRIEWPEFEYFEDLDTLIAVGDNDPVKHPRLVYKPDFENQHWENYDKLYQWVFRRGNTLCYTDEASLVCRGDNIPKHLRALLMQGRELGISCYNATQRPMGIAQVMISEASAVWAFQLQMKQDREKLQNTFAYPVDFLANMPKHAFYCLQQEGSSGAFRLKMEG